MEEQNPDSFSSHSRNQAPLHGFLGDKSHGPPGTALRRVAADHSDNTLFPAVLQHSGRTRPLLLIKRAFEAPFLIAVGDPPDGLRCQGYNAGNTRRADSFGHLQQRHRPQDDAHLLNTANQQLLQVLLVFPCDFDMQGSTSHTLSMRQNIPVGVVLLELFQAVKKLVKLVSASTNADVFRLNARGSSRTESPDASNTTNRDSEASCTTFY